MNKFTMKYDKYGDKSVKVYEPSNVYETAIIGSKVQIGTFCEIGHNVFIGDNVRIGAMCFIPEGVIIESGAWIGPKVTFTNDRFPPSSDKSGWEKTLIQSGARIGAGCVILPGVTIGHGALIGAGSVVTKNVPTHETWCGNPARPLIKDEATRKADEADEIFEEIKAKRGRPKK